MQETVLDILRRWFTSDLALKAAAPGVITSVSALMDLASDSCWGP